MEVQQNKQLKFKNIEEVKAAIQEMSKTQCNLKESLLRCYILNLILYKQLGESHSVKKTLITLSIYIDLLEKAEKIEQPAISNILKEEENLLPENNGKKRVIDYTIEKNKVFTDKNFSVKPEQRNPRIKNKRRYEDAKRLGEKIRKTYPGNKSR